MRHRQSHHQNQNQNQNSLTIIKCKPLRNLKGIYRVVLQNMQFPPNHPVSSHWAKYAARQNFPLKDRRSQRQQRAPAQQGQEGTT